MPSVPPSESMLHEPPPGPVLPADEGSDIPPWPVWTAPAAVGLGLAVGIVVSILVASVAAAGGGSIKNPSPAVALISDLLFDCGFVITALILAGATGKPKPSDFGYRKVHIGLAVGMFFAAGIGYYIVSAIYAEVVNLHANDKLPSELGVSKSTAALVGAAIFVCVVAPIAEEFFFRGFIFGALRRLRIEILGRDLGTWVAAILTGILFGFAHLGSAPIEDLIPLGFLGFVLCLLRWRTRSLYPGMALHSVNNSLALGVGQEHWAAGPVFGLMFGSLFVMAALTGPLATWRPGRATPAAV